MGKSYIPRKNVVKTSLEIVVYYALLYFPDRYLLSPYIHDGIHRSSYNVSGVLVVVLMAVLYFLLLLLAPFFAGRMNRESWAAWGCLSFLGYLASYGALSVVVSLLSGPMLIYTGISVASFGFFDVLPLLHIVLLFCAASWLGSRNARAGAMNRAVRRSRKLALG
jgi:hypothetical protein